METENITESGLKDHLSNAIVYKNLQVMRRMVNSKEQCDSSDILGVSIARSYQKKNIHT